MIPILQRGGSIGQRYGAPVVFTISTAAIGAAAVVMLNALVVAGPRVPAGGQTRALPLNPDSSIAQTFYVRRGPFGRFSFQMTAPRPATGLVVVTIDRLAMGATAFQSTVRVSTIDLRFVTTDVVTMRFQPIVEPHAVAYRARIELMHGDAGAVALFENPASTYPAGALYIDGREQKGDLVFSAGRRDDGRLSVAADLVQGRPRLVASPWTLFAAIALVCAGAGGAVTLALAP